MPPLLTARENRFDALLAETRKRGLFIAQSVIIQPELKEWIHLFPVGRWEQYWGTEDGLELTDVHVAEMVANFKRYGLDVLFDYEHNSLFGDSRAAGWILDVRQEADGLWGKTDWTPAAAEQIKQREWKYYSPAWHLNAVDDKTGERIGARLYSSGLTNIPFFEVGLEQKLVAARGGPKMNPEMKALAAKLGLPETATEKEILTAAAVQLDQHALSENDVAQLAALRAELRIASDETPDSVKAKLAAMRKPEGESETERRLRELETANRTREVESAVQSAFSAGKLAEKDLKWAREFAGRDLAAFTASMANAPVQVPQGRAPQGFVPTLPTNDGTLSAQGSEIAARMGQDPAKVAARAQQLYGGR